MIDFTLTQVASDHIARNQYRPEDMTGLIPLFFDPADLRSAAEQVDANYQHGGGWHSFGKGTWKMAADQSTIEYDPDDGPLRAIATARLRDERLVLYEGSWLAIIQPDGSFDVSRLD